MGVKHTVELTREEAERRVVNAVLEGFRKTLEVSAAKMSNEAIENFLERESDECARRKYGHSGFENYLIVEGQGGPCCVCGVLTTRKDGWYGYRCTNVGCAVL